MTASEIKSEVKSKSWLYS